MSTEQSGALVRRDTSAEVIGRAVAPSPEEIDVFQLGDVLSRSGYFQDAKQAAQCVVKVLAGRELGLGPVASMTGIYIVQGRVTLSANLIAGVIKKSGRYNYRVREMSEKAVEIEFFEGGESIGKSRFTSDDAKAANLNSDTWKKYARNMLFARAMSNGAKWYCPDVFAGPVYTPDELGAQVAYDDAGGERVIEARAEDADVRPAEDERGATVRQIREMCAEMNRSGYQPAWSAVTLDTFANSVSMKSGGLRGCTLEDLRLVRNALAEKLRNVPPAKTEAGAGDLFGAEKGVPA